MSADLSLFTLPDFPLVEPGDNLADQIVAALAKAKLNLAPGDVVVLAQKIVSKSENRYGYLNDVVVSAEAQALAPQIDKDPRLVQLILDESVEVVRQRPGVVIVEHNKGYVHANAGIDKSNISSADDNPRVLLLPLDSDASARALQTELSQKLAIDGDIAIIINDSAGRAWRNGTAGMAIGTAGFEPLVDMIGEADLFNRPMEVTTVAVADELAAAASFLMGQAAEGSPVVLIRGAKLRPSSAGSESLIRPKQQDLFR